MDYIKQVAPLATAWAIETQGTTKNGVLYSKGMDYLQEHTPDILTTSFFRSSDVEEPKKSLYRQLYDKGCYLCCASGNDDRDTLEPLTNGDLWKAIGACRFISSGDEISPKIKIEGAYAQGEEMDYLSLHNLKATWDNKFHKGTSFSAPLFAGMIALVQCFFFLKTGKKLTHDELDKFVRDHCMDLEEEGHDHKTGYGLFILPDPESIDISKYTDEKLIEPDYTDSEEVKEELTLDEIFNAMNEEQKTAVYEIISKALKVSEERYTYLRDIPEGEFHDVISYLIVNKYLFGYNTPEDIEDTEVDLSVDMVRMFVINYRAGLYKARF